MENEEVIARLKRLVVTKHNIGDMLDADAISCALKVFEEWSYNSKLSELEQHNFKDKSNGDVIKAMFPNVRIIEMPEVGVVQVHDGLLGESRNFSWDWWNSPYKGERLKYDNRTSEKGFNNSL